MYTYAKLLKSFSQNIDKINFIFVLFPNIATDIKP